MRNINLRKKGKVAPATAVLTAVLLSLALAACGGGAEETPAPELQFTRAAQTAAALSTELFARTPTQEPASLVATMAAPTATATLEPSPTVAATAAVPTAPAAPAQAGADNATYVSDVTIPDDTVMAPGDTFDKVWRIRNTGTTTWTTDYSLTFIDGEQLGAPAKVPIPNEVSPGEEVEVSIAMTAPQTAGTYFSYWKLTTAAGTLFGFGTAGNEAIWVKIVVEGEAALTTGTPANPAGAVTRVTLNVDSTSASGICPHTFLFTGQVTLNKSAAVTYVLEVGDQSGNAAKAPPAATQNLDSGTHPVVFELTYAGDIAGWARLHVVTPVDLVSNQVNFTLSCG